MWIRELPIVMIRCLLMTVILETIFAIIIGIRNKKDIINVVLVNIITNPLVVAIPVCIEFYYGAFYRNISVMILELFALLFEGFVYTKCFKYKKINGFLVSLILNLISYFAGNLFNHFFYG